jgi:hypothetical protein
VGSKHPPNMEETGFLRKGQAIELLLPRFEPSPEIDEAQWSTLYSTKSYPFDAPKSGKIAVKVINHYGDEVLKVYKVSPCGEKALPLPSSAWMQGGIGRVC